MWVVVVVVVVVMSAINYASHSPSLWRTFGTPVANIYCASKSFVCAFVRTVDDGVDDDNAADAMRSHHVRSSDSFQNVACVCVCV